MVSLRDSKRLKGTVSCTFLHQALIFTEIDFTFYLFVTVYESQH